MNNNINVVNNASDNVKVTINEKDNGIQILIDTVHNNKRRLSELKQYEHFFDKDGEEYIVCEQFKDGTASVLKAELLEKTMNFGKNNNWAESDWREYLNGTYLTELERKFGSENIIPHKVDLTSMDGFDDYGYTMDKVAIRTFDEYRKTSKEAGLVNACQWLATPNQTPSRKDTSYIRLVNDKGIVGYNDCGWFSISVRPFFFLKSSIFVSLNVLES